MKEYKKFYNKLKKWKVQIIDWFRKHKYNNLKIICQYIDDINLAITLIIY